MSMGSGQMRCSVLNGSVALDIAAVRLGKTASNQLLATAFSVLCGRRIQPGVVGHGGLGGAETQIKSEKCSSCGLPRRGDESIG